MNYLNVTLNYKYFKFKKIALQLILTLGQLEHILELNVINYFISFLNDKANLITYYYNKKSFLIFTKNSVLKLSYFLFLNTYFKRYKIII